VINNLSPCTAASVQSLNHENFAKHDTKFWNLQLEAMGCSNSIGFLSYGHKDINLLGQPVGLTMRHSSNVNIMCTGTTLTRVRQDVCAAGEHA
jgi:hypothetical protein